MSEFQSDVPRRLWRRYIVAIALIVGMVCGSFAASEWSIGLSADYAGAINVSGRQRMLSQRILVHANKVQMAETAAEKDTARTVLAGTLDTFAHAHRQMMGEEEANLAPYVTRRLTALYSADTEEGSVDALVREYVHWGRTVVTGPLSAEAEAIAALERMGRSLLLSRLHAVVNQLEQEANDSTARIRMVSWIAFLIAIFIILIEALVIFLPAHRAVKRAFARLEQANADVSAALQTAESARSEAEAATEAKSTFLANMSHEIRTPMNAILGMAQVLSRDDLSDKQRERLGIITESGDTLLRILNDILDLSKVEAGKLEIESVAFDFRDMLKSLRAAYALKADDKELTFTLNVDPSANQRFLGDPTRIRQILGNLISNAIKFTDSGGVVVNVRAQKITPPDGWLLHILVEDTGPGMTPETVKKLFSPFVQADSSTTRRFGGTGLGLSISRQLVELMDGYISVESELGIGSAFSCRIPLQSLGEAQGDASEADNSLEDGFEQPLRLLVAEDNPANRTVMEALLEPFEIDITFARHGGEAVDAWRDGAFDVILMDAQMPVMDGAEATREIRRREADTGRIRTPILAVSADVMEHHIREYQASGMDGWVSKPIKIQELLGAIQDVLEDDEDAAEFDDEAHASA